MVRYAVNVTAVEAKRAGLIDFIAPPAPSADQDRRLPDRAKAQVLHTAGSDRPHAAAVPDPADLVNPPSPPPLLTVGLIGLAIELFSRGDRAGTPARSPSLLGLYGTAQLP
jgi:membrane-bound ClpP family serine protease